MCVHAALWARKILRIFSGGNEKHRDFSYIGLMRNVDDQQRDASDMHKEALSETV